VAKQTIKVHLKKPKVKRAGVHAKTKNSKLKTWNRKRIIENTTNKKQFNYRYMNTLQNVYNKLADKTELAKHEVELATIKDVPRKLKSVLDSQKKLDKSIPELEKLKKDVEGQKALLEVIVKEAQDIVEEVGKKVKDLGLEPSSIEGFRQLETEISNSKSAYLK
jgi:hypothetical protein